jgi:hypothetical protein
MAHRLRFGVADGVLAAAAVAIAVATVWFFTQVSRPAAAAQAGTAPREADARLAADAFVGAVKGADAEGICAILSQRLRGQHRSCLPWARRFIGLTTNGRYLVLAVVMQNRDRARVRVLIDGDHYFWFFVHQRASWRFDEIRAVPSR